jgi:hypothetical protein
MWTGLVEDLKMKAIEAKLREAQKHEQQVLEMVATLPPMVPITTILAQR